MDQFVDLLVTKHGLAGALRSDDSGFDTLHCYFLDRLVPACAPLHDATVQSGETRDDVDALTLMHAGNLCIGAGNDAGYDADGMVRLPIAGLRTPPSA